MKYIDAYRKKVEYERKEVDLRNYLLGKYVMFAFNSPKTYPDKPFLEGIEERAEQEKKIMTSEQMERTAMRNTKILGGKINGNDS